MPVWAERSPPTVQGVWRAPVGQALEALANGLVSDGFGQTRNAVALLEGAMQGRTRQVWAAGRRSGRPVAAGTAAEGLGDRLILCQERGGAHLGGPGPPIGDIGSRRPFGDRLWVDPVSPSQGLQAFFAMPGRGLHHQRPGPSIQRMPARMKDCTNCRWNSRNPSSSGAEVINVAALMMAQSIP